MINNLNKHDLTCSVFSAYDYNDLSMTELLSTFFTKINECIDVSNKSSNLLEWLVNEGLSLEVAKKLVLWLEDGTLENLINVTVFEGLNNKLNELYPIINTTTYISVGDDIQEKINSSKGKVIFEKGDYKLTSDIFLKESTLFDGNGCTIYTNDFRFRLPKGAENIEVINFNFIGNLKYTTVQTLSGDRTMITCSSDVFEVGDVLGCSNYGVIDKPYLRVIAKSGNTYTLDREVNSNGSLLDNEWGAVIGNFTWNSCLTGGHLNDNFTMKNCTFKKSRGYSFDIANSSNLTFENITCSENGLDFTILSAENSNKRNARFINCEFTNQIDFGKQCIAIDGQFGFNYEDIIIDNCRFNKISESALSFGYARGLLNNIKVINSDFKNVKLFPIHIGGTNIIINNNYFNGDSQSCVRINDIDSEIYPSNVKTENIVISGNTMLGCKNGATITGVKLSGGGYSTPKNTRVIDNVIDAKNICIECSGINITIKDNDCFTHEMHPQYFGTIYLSGSTSKNVNISGNNLSGIAFINYSDALNMKIHSNVFNAVPTSNGMWKIKSENEPNKKRNIKIYDNTFLNGNSEYSMLTTNNGQGSEEYYNNIFIDSNDNVHTIPYMKGHPARFQPNQVSDKPYWINNSNNSWIFSREEFLISNGKYGYITDDGTIKSSADITNLPN